MAKMLCNIIVFSESTKKRFQWKLVLAGSQTREHECSAPGENLKQQKNEPWI